MISVASKLLSGGVSFISAGNYGFTVATASASTHDRCGGCVVDSQSNVIVVGYTETTYHESTIVKFSRSGGMAWRRKLTLASTSIQAVAVALDGSDNIYVLCDHLATQYASVVKYNSSGTLQWNKRITKSAAVLTPRSIFHLNGFVYVAHDETSGGCITKLDASTGDTSWSKLYDSGAIALSFCFHDYGTSGIAAFGRALVETASTYFYLYKISEAGADIASDKCRFDTVTTTIRNVNCVSASTNGYLYAALHDNLQGYMLKTDVPFSIGTNKKVDGVGKFQGVTVLPDESVVFIGQGTASTGVNAGYIVMTSSTLAISAIYKVTAEIGVKLTSVSASPSGDIWIAGEFERTASGSDVFIFKISNTQSPVGSYGEFTITSQTSANYGGIGSYGYASTASMATSALTNDAGVLTDAAGTLVISNINKD
jgi:hypothetical protein